MVISMNQNSDVPVYKQLVDDFVRSIKEGRMPAGTQLPTVRALAETHSISKGTVKHAYDTLEQMGFIEKTQGRGSYVAEQASQDGQSKKSQAMSAISGTLDALTALGFSLQEIRIFLDLCLRERESQTSSLRIGVVDCSPEALWALTSQIMKIPGTDVYDFLLETALSGEASFSPPVDIVVTTRTHYRELREKLTDNLEIVQMVLAPSGKTVSLLSRIPENAKVGILCSSKRFSDVIIGALKLYCAASAPPPVQFFGDKSATGRLLHLVDVLILPPNYLRFCTAGERELLQNCIDTQYIEYVYEAERGSLVYLEQEVSRQIKKRTSLNNG